MLLMTQRISSDDNGDRRGLVVEPIPVTTVGVRSNHVPVVGPIAIYFAILD